MSTRIPRRGFIAQQAFAAGSAQMPSPTSSRWDAEVLSFRNHSPDLSSRRRDAGAGSAREQRPSVVGPVWRERGERHARSVPSTSMQVIERQRDVAGG